MSNLVCDRCGREDGTVTDGYEFTDCFGDTVRMKLCWDCDWDVANGRDPFADIVDILEDRREGELED